MNHIYKMTDKEDKGLSENEDGICRIETPII